MNTRKLLVVEELAASWNRGSIAYAVAHGIHDWPRALGRDLDVLVAPNHVEVAKSIADNVFDRYRLERVWVRRDPWPLAARVLVFGEDWELEVDLMTSLSWGPVTLIHEVAQTSHVGPFKVDTWATFAKSILLRILGGRLPSQRLREVVLDANVVKGCERLFGMSLAAQLCDAIQAHDVAAITSLAPRLRIAAIVRAAAFRPLDVVGNSAKWPYREVRPYLRRALPIFAITGPDEARRRRLIQCLEPPCSFLTGISIRESQATRPPRSRVGRIAWFIRVMPRSWKMRALDNFVASTLKVVVHDGLPFESLVAGAERISVLDRLLVRLLPMPDVVIVCARDSDRGFSRRIELLLGRRAAVAAFPATAGTPSIESFVRDQFLRSIRAIHEANSRGLFVAVLGPDGAGKSTQIQYLERELGVTFRDTARFHLMPGLLRRRRAAGPVTDPHGAPLRSTAASIFKLVYFLVEYRLGYWIRVRPAVARAGLVTFDRYYDDLLIDPKRYRYGGPMKLARWLRRFIPRPDLFLVLDVPVETLLERKQEVAPVELRRQREAYRRFAQETPNAFLLDGSRRPEEVARTTREILLDHLHARYLTRRRIWFPADRRGELEWLKEALGVETTDAGRPTHAWLRLPDGRGYLLPLNNSRVFRRGLELYPAQGRKARLGKKGLETLSRLAMNGPGLPRFGLEEREGSVLQTLREVFGRDDLCFAISLGTPGPHRKPVVQVLTPEGEVLGYAKVGWNEPTKALVVNDARMNRKIRELGFSWLRVPDIIHFSHTDRAAMLVTRPLDGVGTGRFGHESIQRFVDALVSVAQRTRQDGSFVDTPFWKCLNHRLAALTGYLPEHQLQSLTRALGVLEDNLGEVRLPWVLRMGDATRWNAAIDEQSGEVVLLDFEYASERWLAGWDLFRFLMDGFSIIPGNEIAEYCRAIGVDPKLANLLQLAFWVDLFTEWALTWKDAGRSMSIEAKREFGCMASTICELTHGVAVFRARRRTERMDNAAKP